MKTHYSCSELAEMKLPGYPETKKGWLGLVAREQWGGQPRSKKGGGNEYLPSKAVQEQINIQRAVTHPSLEQQVMRTVFAELDKIKERERVAKAERAAKAQATLMEMAGMNEQEAFDIQAKCQIAEGWKAWFMKVQPLKKSKSWDLYADAYNMAEVPISKAVREAYPHISGRSAQRWVSYYEKRDFAALIDHRDGSKLRGETVFSHHPLLASAALKLMMDRPSISTQHLYELLGAAAIDRATDELLFTPPSYHQVRRFQKNWIENNKELYLQWTNPDAWKSQYMLALGSYTEEITALNQRWEMDATPADWLLLDEDGKRRRYTVSVIIDVYSRRIMVVVARTPKTQTHCFALRQALLAWGVPQQIVTDNGKDYQSEHFKRVLQALGVEQLTRTPFSPDEKPLIERVIGTLNHSILELLPNFAGHNVADRKAIEARKSFAERLCKPGEMVEMDITGEAMQVLINKWVKGIYEQREHGSLGMSPFARAASWSNGITHIDNVRSLDVLLAPPANGGTRTLQKKGLRIDDAWFVAAEFGDIDVGSEVSVMETEDLGRVIVYYRNNFLCIAECPERTAIDRKVIASMADARQRARLKEGRKQLKEVTKKNIDTNELLNLHLNEKAAAAGKLSAPMFGSTPHRSRGLDEAAKALAAQESPKPSPQAERLAAEAKAAMAQMDVEQTLQKVVAHPSAAQNVSIVAGMTAAEKYDYWLKLDEKNKREGDLEDAEERRWHKVFPNSTTYRMEKSRRAMFGGDEVSQGR